MSAIGFCDNYAAGLLGEWGSRDSGASRRFTHCSEIASPAEALTMLMPIKNQKVGKSPWNTNATDATVIPTSHPTQRIVRSHGSVGRRLTFRRRAITASTPIVTNGNAAPIANIPPSISFVLKATSHYSMLKWSQLPSTIGTVVAKSHYAR
jgi:hypothetical protein